MTIESLLCEYETLRSRHDELEAVLAKRDQQLKSYEAEQERLIEIIKLLRHRQFAPKSEVLPSEDQLHLFDEIEVIAKGSPCEDESEQIEFIDVSAHKKKKPKRKPLPKDLPREVVVVDIPDDQKICPNDGTPMKIVGGEVSERVDVIPMQMKVIQTKRLTYGCPCCESHMKTAAVPLQPIPKGMATAGTLAFIATTKFCDGVSLYHIEKMFERNGVAISRGSMAHWMIRMSDLCQPLINLLDEDLVLGDNYAQIDETTTQVLKEPGKKPQTKSYMWVRARPSSEKPIVIFDYDPTRSGSVAKRLMTEFKGRLQCDGYQGYDELEKNPHIIRHGCMAHARRRFYEATKASKKANIAKYGLKLIQRLYRIEDEARGKPPDEILRVRKERSIPLLADLKKFIDENLHRVPPKSPTGKALNYLHNEWPYLIGYCDDGRVHIDNNFIENKIRPFAIGRNRWLFSDTVDGAKASATLYSLVETAKASRLEPYRYLRHLFEKLPAATELAHFEELLPWNVKI